MEPSNASVTPDPQGSCSIIAYTHILYIHSESIVHVIIYSEILLSMSTKTSCVDSNNHSSGQMVVSGWFIQQSRDGWIYNVAVT